MRFFVSTEPIVLGSYRLSVPWTLVQLQDGAGFLQKVGILRKDPRLVIPGTKRIVMQDAPDRAG
ncbi:MAG: hypothetical protein HY709_10700 [Candidatus Latescibacteria bacterium]|nr:hypothetical protein [Candidatus Latescibacterota bacterium]